MAINFLKTGKAAMDAIAEERLRAATRMATNFRFYIPQNGESRITFLDGDLNELGIPDGPAYREHQYCPHENSSKDSETFVCLTKDDGKGDCPLCDDGVPSYLAQVFTVVEHEHSTKSKGKTYTNQRKLFMAKESTQNLLKKMATKRGGLRGCVFDASRSGDFSPRVGNFFDFCEKMTEAELVAAYGPDAKPLDYEKEVTYKTADELRALGHGAKATPVSEETKKQFSDEL